MGLFFVQRWLLRQMFSRKGCCCGCASSFWLVPALPSLWGELDTRATIHPGARCPTTCLQELARRAPALKPDLTLGAKSGRGKQTQSLLYLTVGTRKWGSSSHARASRDCQEWVPACSRWLRLCLACSPSPAMPETRIELRPALASSSREESGISVALL